MENSDRKLKLPKKLQIQMLKFFLKTSIPRSKEKNPLSDKKIDKEN